MQTQEAIAGRRSCRQFIDKEIPKEDLLKLIDAGRLAATARNEQPWEFIVITDKDKKSEIARLTANNGPFIAEAFACIVVLCADTKYYLEDGSSAITNILLMATGLGIGSCWVAGDKKPYCQALKEILKVPAEYKPVGLIALGYPKNSPAAIAKRGLKEVLHWQKF